jgi:hypothetical protein
VKRSGDIGTIMTVDLKKWFAVAMLATAMLSEAKAADLTMANAAGPLTSFTVGVGNLIPSGSLVATLTGSTRSLARTSSGTFVSALTRMTQGPIAGLGNLFSDHDTSGIGSFDSASPVSADAVLMVQAPHTALHGIDYASGMASASPAVLRSYSIVRGGESSEPEGWMMLPAALLVMGFIARRRRNLA